MSDPLVSVIMPAFNAGLSIAQSIETVLAQTFTNWELIIVNDGSTDDTQFIAQQYVLADERVRLINQENKKLSAARNTGFFAARGKWIAFLDADDLWASKKLEVQLNSAATVPSAGVIFSSGFTFYEDDIGRCTDYETIAGLFKGKEIYKLQYQGNQIAVLSVLVRKEHVDAIGPQDEQLLACEDWDYWLRLAAAGVSFYGIPDKLFYYRRHSNNMSNNNQRMLFAQASVFAKNLRTDLMDKSETLNAIGFINRSICSFINWGLIDKALFLNQQLREKFSGTAFLLNSFFIKTLKRRSYYLVRIVNRLNLTLN